jgi:hypothetical protein
MYSFTRCVTPQQAAIAIGIRKVVSITNSTLIPSTPTLYCRPKQPLRLLHQLEAGVVGVELHQDEERHEEGRQRREGQPFGVQLRRLVIAAQEHGHDERRDQRQEGDDGKKVVHQSLSPPASVAQVIRTTIPSTIAKA